MMVFMSQLDRQGHSTGQGDGSTNINRHTKDLIVTVFFVDASFTYTALSSDPGGGRAPRTEGTGGIHDQITSALENTIGDRFVRLPNDIDLVRSVVGGVEYSLDVLVYADVGMEMSSYLLSHSRLAPIQV
jgi:hypothetical protein